MLKTKSFTGLLTILQSLIDMVDKDEVDRGKNGGNEIYLSNPSALKKSTEAGYLTSKSNKKGGSNTKKGFKAAKGFNYLTLGPKKPLNFYGMRLHKRLFFNTLIRNSTSGLKPTHQAML